jgi:hypothetical protein
MDQWNGKSLIMIRIVKHTVNSKEGYQTGIIMSIDTETGEMSRKDYRLGEEDAETLTLLNNLRVNGVDIKWRRYFPDNPKIKKEDRTQPDPPAPDDPPIWNGGGSREPISGI